MTALGQSAFDNDVVVYAAVEITDFDGGRTLVEKVAVGNDVGAVLGMGCYSACNIDPLSRGIGVQN